MKRSIVAVAAGLFGALSLFDIALGPLLIHAGWVTPIFGFQWLFLLGLLEGLVALLLGAVALYLTRAGARRGGRALARFGFLAGVVAATVLVLAAVPGREFPPINDITTDLADPPAFTSDPSGRGRDMGYPTDFVPQVKAAYSDLAPIRVASDPTQALVLAEDTAKALGWDVAQVDPAAGTLLASQTSRVFQFVDDILVRVRPHPEGGSVVDVRSKSRDGRGDLGKNAARIREFAARLPR
jgi:uncharacterized protein (DUF1499 family)